MPWGGREIQPPRPRRSSSFIVSVVSPSVVGRLNAASALVFRCTPGAGGGLADADDVAELFFGFGGGRKELKLLKRPPPLLIFARLAGGSLGRAR